MKIDDLNDFALSSRHVDHPPLTCSLGNNINDKANNKIESAQVSLFDTTIRDGPSPDQVGGVCRRVHRKLLLYAVRPRLILTVHLH